MLVVMQAHATDEQVRAVCRKIESLGYRAHPMPGAQRTAVCVTGNRGEVEAGTLEESRGRHAGRNGRRAGADSGQQALQAG